MPQVKLANGLLWTANVLIGVGVVLFAFNFLLFPKKIDDLGIEIVDPTTSSEGRKTPPPNYQMLAMMANPFTKDSKSAGPDNTRAAVGFPSKISLLGFLGETAFFDVEGDQAQAERQSLLVIHRRDRPEEQVEGWLLAEISSERALFRNPATGQEHTVLPGTGSTGPTAMVDSRGVKNWKGVEFDAGKFRKTRKVSSTPDREEWMVDPDEGDWLNQNLDMALSECQLTQSGAGGLEISGLPSGSVGSHCGLQQGDVIRAVNGQQLATLADLKKLQAGSGKTTMFTLTLDRGGNPFTIVYRPSK